MRLTISGMNMGCTKDILNAVADTFNRTSEQGFPISVIIEDEKGDE